MSRDFENKHPRDKSGQFVDKHESRPANIKLGTSDEGLAHVTPQEVPHLDWEKRLEIADNSYGHLNTDQKDAYLDVLVDDPEPLVRINVAIYGRDNDTLALCNDPNTHVRAVAQEEYRHRIKCAKEAVSPDVTEERLDELARHKSDMVRFYVSENPNTSSDTLNKMLESAPPRRIKRNIGKHPNTPDKTLQQLIREDDPIVVGFGVVLNENCPTDILKQCTNHSNRWVRDNAHKQLQKKNKTRHNNEH